MAKLSLFIITGREGTELFEPEVCMSMEEAKASVTAQYESRLADAEDEFRDEEEYQEFKDNECSCLEGDSLTATLQFSDDWVEWQITETEVAVGIYGKK